MPSPDLYLVDIFDSLHSPLFYLTFVSVIFSTPRLYRDPLLLPLQLKSSSSSSWNLSTRQRVRIFDRLEKRLFFFWWMAFIFCSREFRFFLFFFWAKDFFSWISNLIFDTAILFCFVLFLSWVSSSGWINIKKKHKRNRRKEKGHRLGYFPKIKRFCTAVGEFVVSIILHFLFSPRRVLVEFHSGKRRQIKTTVVVGRGSQL